MDYVKVCTKLFWLKLTVSKYHIGLELEDSKEARFLLEK
jgi:hypothetical protein